jgi:hypothetical protein
MRDMNLREIRILGSLLKLYSLIITKLTIGLLSGK